MKGMVLAGGSGKRLSPITNALSKQLVPVYDKPMIYYPITTLILAGIREILVITAPESQSMFCRLLGSGSQWGLSFSYRIQPNPEGIAQAYIIGAEYVGDAPSALILGDNLFFGHGLGSQLQSAAAKVDGATIFCSRVDNPSSYGVVSFDSAANPLALEEKPAVPKSDYAVLGLYFYDGRAVEWAERLVPSARGELEITDLNRLYLEAGDLKVKMLDRDFVWFDAGTHDTLLQAGEFMRAVEQRQGVKIGCPEEAALAMGFIDVAQFSAQIAQYAQSPYGQYLKGVLARYLANHSQT